MDCVNQDEGECLFTTLVAVRYSTICDKRVFIFNFEHLADTADLILLIFINKVRHHFRIFFKRWTCFVVVPLVVVDHTILITRVEVLLVLRKGQAGYRGTVVLNGMDEVSVLVVCFKFKYPHTVVHVATSIQIVFLCLVVIVLLEDVVKPVRYMFVSQLQIEALSFIKVTVDDTLFSHVQD